MAGKFELKKDMDGQFVFNLKAPNGRIILTSDLYLSRIAARNAIEATKKNAADNNRYEYRKSGESGSYFILRATNRQIIGRSNVYSSVSAMKSGIASVKTNAPDAIVEDLTI